MCAPEEENVQHFKHALIIWNNNWTADLSHLLLYYIFVYDCLRISWNCIRAAAFSLFLFHLDRRYSSASAHCFRATNLQTNSTTWNDIHRRVETWHACPFLSVQGYETPLLFKHLSETWQTLQSLLFFTLLPLSIHFFKVKRNPRERDTTFFFFFFLTYAALIKLLILKLTLIYRWCSVPLTLLQWFTALSLNLHSNHYSSSAYALSCTLGFHLSHI